MITLPATRLAHWCMSWAGDLRLWLWRRTVAILRTLQRTWPQVLRQIAILGAFAAIAIFWGLAVVIMEVNAFILAFSLIACLFILHDFRAGVVLLIVLMPISASRLFPHEMLGVTGLNPLNLLLFATLGSFALRSLFSTVAQGFLPARVLWLYIVPIVIAGAMGSRHVNEIPPFFTETLDVVSYDSASGYLRDVVIKPLFLVLYALLVAAAVRVSKKPEELVVPTLLSIWLMGLIVLVYFIATGVHFGDLASERARQFLSPLGMHANDLGRLYATAYALLLFTWARSTGIWIRTLLLASMALVFCALLLTFSRGAFFSFIVVNLIYLWWNRQLKVLFFGGPLAAAAIAVTPGAIVYRLSTGFGQGANAVSAGRLDEIWLPLLPELLRSPVFGNGLSSILWSDAMRNQIILPVAHPHNAYLGALLDMGIVGMVLMLLFYGWVWRGFARLARSTSVSAAERGFFEGAMAALLALLVAGFAGSSLTPVPEQSFLWLAIGVMFGVSSKLRSSTSLETGASSSTLPLRTPGLP